LRSRHVDVQIRLFEHILMMHAWAVGVGEVSLRQRQRLT
jgi:hypothetical protein